MINNIYLSSAGAFNGTNLSNLKQLNFIFGSNGSGKTTISRVVNNDVEFPSCRIDWKLGPRLDRRVYNRNFVANHFDNAENIKGIYTFGGNVEIARVIQTLKSEQELLEKKIIGFNKVLSGEDGKSGKEKELKDLYERFIDDVWNAKKTLNLDDSFAGLEPDLKLVDRPRGP